MEIRKFIRESLREQFLDEDNLEEERISHKEAAQKVKQLKNFIGSHTYGEDIGDLEQMYVVYSYGEQFPLYIHYKDSWYENTDSYELEDGVDNVWTEKHRKQLRPGIETQGRPKVWMQKMIKKFKKTHGLGKNSHSDLEPGEK